MKKRWITKANIKKTAFVVAGCVAMGCVATFSTGDSDSVVHAMTKQEAEDQKNEAQENEKEAKGVLESLEAQQNKIVQEVADLDAQATEMQTQITKQEAQSDDLKQEISETQKKLDEAQKAEDEQYEAMKQRIQYLYEEGEVEYMDALLSSMSFSDILNKSEYIDQMSEYDQKQLAKLVKTKNEIAQYESDLQADLRQVESLKTDLQNNQTQLQALIDQKQEQLSVYDDDVEAQKSLMAKFTAQREAAEKLIAQLSRQEAGKAGTNSVYTPDGKVYDTSKYAGRFMWPVSTGGVITDEFGYRDAPTAGASTYHQGLDIGCDYGTDIVAAEDGTVILSSYNGGGGNMVMISHYDGICTVYMHNSQLCVNVGEKVVKGQVIAKAGSTGVSTGPHCHFGVSIDGTYVNPHDFLGQ